MARVGIRSGVLFGTTMLFWFAQYAYAPYLNPELENMGASAVFMGFVGGSYGFTQLMLRLPLGIIADRWQKKFFIWAGCFCTGTAALSMMFFYNPVSFFVGRALCGVAAATWVPFTVLFSSYYEPKESARSITLINLASQIGRIFSFLCAGLIVARFGPRYSFLLAAAGGFIASIMSLSVYEERKTKNKEPLRVSALIAVAKDRNLFVTSILAALIQMVAWGTYFTFVSNYAVFIGAGQEQLSYLNIFLLAASSMTNFLVSRYFLRSVSAECLVIIGFFMTAIYSGLLPLAQTVPQVYVMQVIAGVGNALSLYVLMGMCVRDIPVEKRGAAMGFFQAIYGLGMTVGPVVMGFLTDHFSIQTGFFFMGGLCALSGLASIFWLRKPAPKEI